jgi:replicative superfamily II helicase
LVPSNHNANAWKDIGIISSNTTEVAENIKKLQRMESKGPFIFANRYDGIDLPGDSCRLLIFAGMPRGANEYENYLSFIFEGSILNNTLAQKIEQGIGRGARGSGDYCVVLLQGKDVVSWIASSRNIRFLTRITHAELEIGTQISQNIRSRREMWETILKCLKRDRDWVRYHAEILAVLSEQDPILISQLQHADIERKSLKLWRDGHYDKAINKITKYCENCGDDIDVETKGWLYQLAARIAYKGNMLDNAMALQRQAYAYSHNLLRPKEVQHYTRLVNPGKQAEQIVSRIKRYKIRKGYLAKFDEIITHLVPESTANQFEQALATLGEILGFMTERPERNYGIGPDVLWLLDDDEALVIEAKSRKNDKNPLTKDQHGQLLSAQEWFKREYPNYSSTRVSVHPNRSVTANTAVGETKALIPNKLNELVSSTRSLVKELSESLGSDETLSGLCELLLDKYSLRPKHILADYLVSFDTVDSD